MPAIIDQYYWIKLKDSDKWAPLWTVAYRTHGCWVIVGHKSYLGDSMVDIVGDIVKPPGPITIKELADGKVD